MRGDEGEREAFGAEVLFSEDFLIPLGALMVAEHRRVAFPQALAAAALRGGVVVAGGDDGVATGSPSSVVWVQAVINHLFRRH